MVDAAVFEQRLNGLRVPDLKEILRGKGLRVSGAKDILINRIVSYAVESGSLNEIWNEIFYEDQQSGYGDWFGGYGRYDDDPYSVGYHDNSYDSTYLHHHPQQYDNQYHHDANSYGAYDHWPAAAQRGTAPSAQNSLIGQQRLEQLVKSDTLNRFKSMVVH